MSITLNKNELAKIMSDKKGTKISDEIENINILFDTIEEELIKGNDVKIVGFGAFKCVVMEPRTVVNPKTSEQFKIGKRISFKFARGKHLVDIFKDRSI